MEKVITTSTNLYPLLSIVENKAMEKAIFHSFIKGIFSNHYSHMEKYQFSSGSPMNVPYYGVSKGQYEDNIANKISEDDLEWLRLSEISLADWDNEDDDFFNTLLPTR